MIRVRSNFIVTGAARAIDVICKIHTDTFNVTGTVRVASALVNSRFDLKNAVLYGTSEHNLGKLRAQNALARVVTFTITVHLDHVTVSAPMIRRSPVYLFNNYFK